MDNRHSLLHHSRLLRAPPEQLAWSPPKPNIPADATPLDCNFEIEELLDFSPCDDDAASSCSAPLDSAALPLDFQNPKTYPSAENPKPCAGADPKKPDDGASNAGLCAPPDELVDVLEWLSAFNEDSSYSGDTRLASLVRSGNLGGGKAMEEIPLMCTDRTIDSFYITSPVSVLEQISTNSYVFTHFDRPKRSRRSRIGGRIWSLDILKPVSMTSKNKDAFEASFTFMSSNNESFNSSFLQQDEEMIETQPSKKLRRVSSGVEDAALIRRCSHCLVQKTPQWRAGPLGPKTLCNACGVRYKSGRLVPEYRPACSPTFISEVHSNSHRRILEMRRAREMEVHSGELHEEMQESLGDFMSHNELHKATMDAFSGKVHSNRLEDHSDKVHENTMEAHSNKVGDNSIGAHCKLKKATMDVSSIELHDDDDNNNLRSRNDALPEESPPSFYEVQSFHTSKALVVTLTEARASNEYDRSEESDEYSEELSC